MTNKQKFELLNLLKFEGTKTYGEMLIDVNFKKTNELYREMLYGEINYPRMIKWNLSDFHRLAKLMKFGEKHNVVKIDRTHSRKFLYSYL